MKKKLCAILAALTIVLAFAAPAEAVAIIMDKGAFAKVNYTDADFVDNQPASANKTSVKRVDAGFQSYEWGYLKINWKAKSKARGYQVEYSTDADFNTAYRCSMPKTYASVTKQFSAGQLKSGAVYYVRVRAMYKHDKAGPWSKTAAITKK